jgi:hypothetical protein
MQGFLALLLTVGTGVHLQDIPIEHTSCMAGFSLLWAGGMGLWLVGI